MLKSSPTRRRLGLSNKIRWEQAGEVRSAANVTVGGPAGRFEPHTHSAKWRNEGWMTLVFPESKRDLQRPIFGGNLAEVISAGDRKHRYFVDDNGDLEYELVLGVKPASNVFEFQIDFPAKMEFLYQPPLNRGPRDGRWTGAVTEIEAFDAAGNLKCSRPEHIVGSYAVYWPKTNNEYQTGKFCHILRPKFIDVLGRWTWGELFIDTDRKRMHVKCPPRWLERAMYPVTLDPTIGYTSLGASTDNSDGYVLVQEHTASSSGDANPGTGNCGGAHAGGATVYCAVYAFGDGSVSGNSRLAFSSAISYTSTAGFRSAAITLTGITASAKYYLATWSNTAGVTNRYDSGSGTGRYQESLGNATPTDPFPATGDSGAFNNRLSNYVDYTASGGGGGRTTKNTRAFPLGMYVGMNWRQCNV